MGRFDMGRVPPVTFGAGRVAELPDLAKSIADGPVFVIADKVLADLGVTAKIANLFAKAGIGCEISAEIAGEPKEALIDALCFEVRDAEASCVIGIGGGAAMDTAKLVAAIAPSKLAAANFALSAEPLPQNGLPAIAVPTTAGTGSEVTRTSIVSTSQGHKNWYCLC